MPTHKIAAHCTALKLYKACQIRATICRADGNAVQAAQYDKRARDAYQQVIATAH